MLGKLVTTISIDGKTKRIMIEIMFEKKVVCKSACLNISSAWDTMVSSKTFQ